MSHPITYKYKINFTVIPTILCFLLTTAKNKVKTERVQLTISLLFKLFLYFLSYYNIFVLRYSYWNKHTFIITVVKKVVINSFKNCLRGGG